MKRGNRYALKIEITFGAFESDSRIVSSIEEQRFDSRMDIDEPTISIAVLAWESPCVAYRILAERIRHKEFLTDGDYVPLDLVGERSENVVAFARCLEDKWLITVEPRFTSLLADVNHFPLGNAVWGDAATELSYNAPGRWCDIFTEKSLANAKSLRIQNALSEYPVSILIG